MSRHLNLAFRTLFEKAAKDENVQKLLVVDRTPKGRLRAMAPSKAPALLYPDFLASVPQDCRIDLDLRRFLIEKTEDENWPAEADDPKYARLIVRCLPEVLEAHRNLRAAHASRFTDGDFRTIIAFAVLGIGTAAFRKLAASDYWRIGLLSHQALGELEPLLPEIVRPIRDALAKAPPPFCHFVSHDPAIVARAFYLALILSQHVEDWGLLLAAVQPELRTLAGIAPEVLAAAPKLIALDTSQASSDVTSVEQCLASEQLQLLLLDRLHVDTTAGFVALLEKEKYSTLFRTLALLMALDNLLSAGVNRSLAERVLAVLKGTPNQVILADTNPPVAWTHLKEAYQLAYSILPLREELTTFVRNVKVAKPGALSFAEFWKFWNERKVNRLEYYLSVLQRRTESADFLPRPEEELPGPFVKAVDRIRQRVALIVDEVSRQLDEMNRRFQEVVVAQYPAWADHDGEVYLTSQFLRRCLKPNWDPQTEKAAVFVFDGMRYDIWDELVRPQFEEYMETVTDLPASSILPSETQLTRKAISAGAFPDAFDSTASEDRLLQESLQRELGYNQEVKVIAPPGAGTGETVRYRAGNLDLFIFELCDKELHGVTVRSLPGGRLAPSRPLAFIYQQFILNVVNTEVAAILRTLKPGTKVFVTADHGFARSGRDKIWFDLADLNDPYDCQYTNCSLKTPWEHVNLPPAVRQNVISFTPQQLHLSAEEQRKAPPGAKRQVRAVVFPRVGYAFSRQGSPFNPDAFVHGGISVQELMIPMVVLRVREPKLPLISVSSIQGPSEVAEGQSVEFRVRLTRNGDKKRTAEVKVTVSGSYSGRPDLPDLRSQTVYVTPGGTDIVYQLTVDGADASEEERRAGSMQRTLAVTAAWQEGGRNITRSVSHRINIRLNPAKIIRRVPPQLGTILGMTPKDLR